MNGHLRTSSANIRPRERLSLTQSAFAPCAFASILFLGTAEHTGAQVLIPVTWVGESDNWIEPGSWAPEPLDIDNFFLLWPDNTLSSNYFAVIVPSGQITLKTPVSVTSLTIDNSAELRISNIGALTLELFGLSGSLAQNEGRIRISDSGSLKALSLTGGGEVVLSDSAQVNGLTLNASGQTIRGAGVINSIFNLDALVNAGTLSGDAAGGTLRVAGVGLVNQGTAMATSGGRLKIETPFLTNGGLVDADAGAVAIDVGTFTNSGTVRARNEGSVRYASITADGAGGLVEVLTGSRLSVDTSILNGGLFRTSGTGLVHFDEGDSRLTGSPVLEGSFLIGAGTLDIRDAEVNANLATLTATAATVTVRNSTLYSGTYAGAGAFTVMSPSVLSGKPNPATIDTAEFAIPGGKSLQLVGEIRLNNGGRIGTSAVGFNVAADLWCNGAVLLSGNGGAVVFSPVGTNSGNRLLGMNTGVLTTGVNTSLLAPTAAVGSVYLPLVNHGTVAATGGFIEIINTTIANDGLITSSGGGRVQLGQYAAPTEINNTGGTLRAGAGGSITFSGSVSQIPGVTTIRGGTLDGAGTFTNQRFTTLDGVTHGAVTLRDAVFVTSGNTRTTALGTLLFDNGTLRFVDENNLVGSIDASLSVAGPVLLGGTGTLDFSHTGFGPYNNSIEGADTAALLTIGPGISVRADSLNDVGSFTTDTVHQGHTHASNGGLIQFVNVSTTNTGIIEASASGRVQIGRANLPTTLNNTGGTLRAGAGGSITLSGSVSQIPGVTTVQGGTIDGTGVVFSGPYSILNGHTSEPVSLRDTTLRILDGQLHLAGTITLDGAGIELQDNRFGLGSGVSRLRTDNDASVNGTGMIRFLVGNEGGQPETLIETPSGSLTLSSGVTVLATIGAQGSLSGTYFNAGTIHAQGGLISLGVTSLQNIGTIRTSTGGSIIAGRSGAAALFDNSGGTFWAETGTDIAFPFSQTIARGGVYQGPGTFTAGSSVQLDGTTSGPVTLRDTTFRAFNHSVLNLAGTITLENATLRLQDRQFQLGTPAILRTGNDVTITGAGTIELAQNSEGNASENRIDIAAGSLTIGQGVALRIPAGSGSLISGGPLTIQGLFQCDAVGGSDPANLIYAPVTITSTGTLAGSGTFLLNSGLTVHGTVSPGASPGTLTVERFFPGVASVHTPAAKLLFEIGGTTSGTQHDVFKVSGYLNLDGAMLRPRFINNFQNSITPAATFTVIETLLPIIGSFSNVFNGRVMAADGSGTFSVTFAANGTRVILGDFIAGAVIDSDGDGMSDEFEQQYFRSPVAANPATDSDYDGQTNLQEYLAGTNPVDSTSVLRIKEIRRDGEDIVIFFEAASDKGYEVRAGANLIDGFQTLIQTLAPTPIGGIRSVTDTGAAATHPRRFYRVEVVQ